MLGDPLAGSRPAHRARRGCAAPWQPCRRRPCSRRLSATRPRPPRGAGCGGLFTGPCSAARSGPSARTGADTRQAVEPRTASSRARRPAPGRGRPRRSASARCGRGAEVDARGGACSRALRSPALQRARTLVGGRSSRSRAQLGDAGVGVGGDRGQDELVGRRVRVRHHLLEHGGGDGVALHLELGVERPGRGPADVDRREPGLLQQLVEGGAGEEAQVGVVEQADPPVAPLAAEQREPDAGVGDVRDADDDVAAGGEQPPGLPQHRQRLHEVLQHVAEHDDVEPVLAELGREVQLLEVADEHLLAVRAGQLGRGRVDLDAGDAAAAGDQCAGEVALGAPDVEHPLVAADQSHHDARGWCSAPGSISTA